MNSHPQKYYICKSGEVKRRAEEHRATFLRLKRGLWKIVNELGSDRAIFNNRMMLIEGVAFKGDPPPGWTKPNHGISYPKRGTLAPETRKYFTPSGSYFVTPHKEMTAFCDWLKCPFHYSYKTKNVSGSRCLGGLFAEDFVFWYDEKGPILLILPDVASAKKKAADNGETVDGDVLDWRPPKGLKEILKQEWALMEAKHEIKEKGNKK